MTHPTICIYEDREVHLVAIELAVLTLRRDLPGSHLIVSLGGRAAAATAGGADPVRGFLAGRGVEVLADEQLGGSGWDVKPALLLARLRQGHDDVIWWDSDLLACSDGSRDLAPLLQPRTPQTLVATEDTWWGEEQGTGARTRGFGWEVGRTFPRGFNSCLLRVGQAHIELLETWRALLLRPDYLQAQQLPGDDRPLHLLGDQEPLAALLGSAAWAHVDVQLVRRGRDIAQAWGPAGYRVRERLGSLRHGRPVLAHGTVTKPWELQGGPEGEDFPPRPPRGRDRKAWESWYDGLHAQLSPYTMAARAVGHDLPEQPAWLRRRSRTGRVLAGLPGDPLVVPELPLAAVDATVRGVKRRRHPTTHRVVDLTRAGDPTAPPGG